jgi:hypothetical protein
MLAPTRSLRCGLMPWALLREAGFTTRIVTLPARGNRKDALKVEPFVRTGRLTVIQPVPAALPCTLTRLPGAAGVTLPVIFSSWPTAGVASETLRVTLNLGAAVALSATNATENEPAIITSRTVRSLSRAVIEIIISPARIGYAKAQVATHCDAAWNASNHRSPTREYR